MPSAVVAGRMCLIALHSNTCQQAAVQELKTRQGLPLRAAPCNFCIRGDSYCGHDGWASLCKVLLRQVGGSGHSRTGHDGAQSLIRRGTKCDERPGNLCAADKQRPRRRAENSSADWRRRPPSTVQISSGPCSRPRVGRDIARHPNRASCLTITGRADDDRIE